MEDQREFKDEDFTGNAAQFDMEYLERISSTDTEPSALTRQSLYVKFDPLVGMNSPVRSHSKPSAEVNDVLNEMMMSDSHSLEMPVLGNFCQPLDPTAVLSGSGDIPTQDRKQFVQVVPLLAEVEADKTIYSLQKGELKYSEDELEKVKHEFVEAESLKYSEELTALQKELQDAENVVTEMRSTKPSGALIREIHKQENILLEAELNKWRKLISDHEQMETRIVSNHEEVKSKVRMIEEQCSTARNHFSSLENALDNLSQRYVALRESTANLYQDRTRNQKLLTELENTAVELSEQTEQIKFKYRTAIDNANLSYESLRKDVASKLAVERVSTKKLDLHVAGLEREVLQKEQEKQQLTQICDELLLELGRRQ